MKSHLQEEARDVEGDMVELASKVRKTCSQKQNELVHGHCSAWGLIGGIRGEIKIRKILGILFYPNSTFRA